MNRIDNVQRENDPNFDGSGTDMDKDIEKIACLKNLKGLLSKQSRAAACFPPPLTDHSLLHDRKLQVCDRDAGYAN